MENFYFIVSFCAVGFSLTGAVGLYVPVIVGFRLARSAAILTYLYTLKLLLADRIYLYF